ncbi:MAG: ABC transporter ATP-binding protein [Alphaproteobacteria bacterium]|nr:ABC transporter ATP-binding protein [Alphaproteobacteria bacterium]
MAGQGPDHALAVENLSVAYPLKGRDKSGARRRLLAVDDVSFAIRRGTTLGIVGESGSGKTTAAMAAALDAAALRRARQRVQIIFQDPYSSLNPRLRAAEIVREPMLHAGRTNRAEQDRVIDELFEAVGLRPEQKSLFPHQFSGGQRQRIGIARALSTRPSLIICDEPVSALDVAVQAQILNLLKSLQRQFDLTYLFISHDLGVVQHMCDEVAVMYMGKFMEQAERDSFFAAPRHPYSRALLDAVPTIEAAARPRPPLVDGAIPDLSEPQTGCRFASRCPHAMPRCENEVPLLADATGAAGHHRLACHLADEIGSAASG